MQNYNSKFKISIRERAYQYAIKIIQFIEALQKDLAIQIIAKQLLRSATSVGANIVEAKASSSKRDLINFITYSLKSANESLFWLGLLKDAKKIENDQLDYLLQETLELANILGASILTLKDKR